MTTPIGHQNDCDCNLCFGARFLEEHINLTDRDWGHLLDDELVEAVIDRFSAALKEAQGSKEVVLPRVPAVDEQPPRGEF